MPYYKTCGNCGATLDPGETCNCRKTGREETRGMYEHPGYGDLAEAKLIELSLIYRDLLEEQPDNMTWFMTLFPERLKIRQELERRGCTQEAI